MTEGHGGAKEDLELTKCHPDNLPSSQHSLIQRPSSPSRLWCTLSSISLGFSLSLARERAWLGWPVVTRGLRRVEGV